MTQVVERSAAVAQRYGATAEYTGDGVDAIERLAATPSGKDLAIRDIWLLRLRALLARARGDDHGHRYLVSRYRAMAESLGFDGHIAWAEAMVDDRGGGSRFGGRSRH
jgi:hypothetical protein